MLVEAGQRERPPGAAQPGRQRGRVGTVAGHVADEHGDLAVGRLHRVVEVAAQLGALPAGVVAHRQAHIGGVQLEGRRERPLHAGVVGPAALGREQVTGEAGRPLALDGVAHRAGQELVVDPPLHEVVLRPGRHGLHAQALAGGAGEDHHGRVRRVGHQLLDPGDALGVGQAHVQQHAVDEADGAPGVGQPGDPLHPGARQAVGQQLAHQQRVAVVVLDHQQLPAPRPGPGRMPAARWSRRRGPGQASSAPRCNPGSRHAPNALGWVAAGSQCPPDGGVQLVLPEPALQRWHPLMWGHAGEYRVAGTASLPRAAAAGDPRVPLRAWPTIPCMCRYA